MKKSTKLMAVTQTFTELQQQLLGHIAAGTGLTWFMENRKLMYVFAKRASNRKFKKEIEAKWLIMRTLSALKEKKDDLVVEFFENPRTKTACAIAEATQELQKQQQMEGRRAYDQSRVDSGMKGEPVAVAKDTMEVDGTGPSGIPKVVKKEEFDALIRPKINTLDEAMRQQIEKGKAKAPDMAASSSGKALEEITVCKMDAPKKRAVVKLKEMIGSDTNEVGEAGSLVAGPSKPHGKCEPSSNEGKQFPELGDDDDESDIGKRRNPHQQAKPRKGSMALPKTEFLERNMCGMTCLPSLGPTDGEFGREMNRKLASNATQLHSIDWGLKLVLNMLGQNGMADTEGSVEQRSELAHQAEGSADNRRTLVSEWARHHSHTPMAAIATEPVEPAITMPAPPSLLPPPLPDMPPPPPAISPPCTPLLAPHHALSLSQAPASPSTLPPHSPSPTHSLSLAHDLPTASSPPAPSQIQAASKDVNMELASSPAVAAPIVMVQEPTPHANTALANLSHALAQLQVPPPQMTRAQSATLTEPLRRSTCSTSRTSAPDNSKAAKRKATGSALTKTKRIKK
ncbi:hypothetical protein BDN71DRAFT_1436275 [Pleurotus eryngii]|uniref:Uncharacterized protein n=1 Tax=Pleurotus eryngii TaxID=5323 RepID=A0A9P5ZJA0_PLEER|nr:hypothetical protein BDN71DRAFT_1436275 [Pleurotus eryngii]